MSKKLKVGVIGLGMGWGHLCGFAEHPAVELTAAADAQPEKLDRAHTELGVGRCYRDGFEMIKQEKLDIVSIAVPNFLHCPLTLAALSAGAHVLCEKPMALNAVEAESMLEAARHSKRKLGINFSYRFAPQSQAMKSVVDSGALGDIYYGRSVWLRRRGVPGLHSYKAGGWFFKRETAGGGPLIDLGVHRLDFALWLMGYPEVAWVMGSTYAKIAPALAKQANMEYSVEDFACAMIRFKNGATLELDASWAANIAENEQMSTRLLGDQGGIFQRNLDETYTFNLEYYRELDGKQFDCKLHDPVPEVRSSYYCFADAVAHDTPFCVKPEEGVEVMKILDAIYLSARTGDPVKF